jgi:hypothetical protein
MHVFALPIVLPAAANSLSRLTFATRGVNQEVTLSYIFGFKLLAGNSRSATRAASIVSK